MGFYASSGVSVAAFTTGIGPVQSLVGKSATSSVPAVFDAGTVRPSATLVVTTSTGVSAGAVALSASMDSINWWLVPSGSITTSAASTTSQVTSTSAYARFFRAAVTTTVTGGTVTAWVAAAG
jgi:hypothetical protein